MRIFNKEGKYTDEFREYRWNLICDIHQQGIKTSASFIGVAAIAANNSRASIEALDKIRVLLVSLAELDDEVDRQRAMLEAGQELPEARIRSR